MRHKNHSTRLGRTSSHRLALMRNMAKSFIINEKLTTTVEKAKELKKVVEPLITLSTEDNLTNRRRAIQLLGVRFNQFTPKEARELKNGGEYLLNDDRKLIKKLFTEIGPKYKGTPGGYTRIVRTTTRQGDGAELCVIEGVR